jgi:hypothetical protein
MQSLGRLVGHRTFAVCCVKTHFHSSKLWLRRVTTCSWDCVSRSWEVGRVQSQLRNTDPTVTNGQKKDESVSHHLTTALARFASQSYSFRSYSQHAFEILHYTTAARRTQQEKIAGNTCCLKAQGTRSGVNSSTSSFDMLSASYDITMGDDLTLRWPSKNKVRSKFCSPLFFLSVLTHNTSLKNGSGRSGTCRWQRFRNG